MKYLGKKLYTLVIFAAVSFSKNPFQSIWSSVKKIKNVHNLYKQKMQVSSIKALIWEKPKNSNNQSLQKRTHVHQIKQFSPIKMKEMIALKNRPMKKVLKKWKQKKSKKHSNFPFSLQTLKVMARFQKLMNIWNKHGEMEVFYKMHQTTKAKMTKSKMKKAYNS